MCINPARTISIAFISFIPFIYLANILMRVLHNCIMIRPDNVADCFHSSHSSRIRKAVLHGCTPGTAYSQQARHPEMTQLSESLCMIRAGGIFICAD